MRCFVSLVLPDTIRPDLAGLSRGILGGRPVPEAHLHLTLAFLGDQSQAQLEDLHEYLSDIAVPQIDLSFGALAFIGGEPPRCLAVDVLPNPTIQGLQKSVLSAARMAGITVPTKRFRPHVTLVRFSRGDGAVRTALRDSAQIPAVTADQIALVHSILRREGARYETLATYPVA